jgi:hypothetical protein
MIELLSRSHTIYSFRLPSQGVFRIIADLCILLKRMAGISGYRC